MGRYDKLRENVYLTSHNGHIMDHIPSRRRNAGKGCNSYQLLGLGPIEFPTYGDLERDKNIQKFILSAIVWPCVPR